MEVIGRRGEGKAEGEVERRGGEVLHRKEEVEKVVEGVMEITVGGRWRMMALRPAPQKEVKPTTDICLNRLYVLWNMLLQGFVCQIHKDFCMQNYSYFFSLLPHYETHQESNNNDSSPFHLWKL